MWRGVGGNIFIGSISSIRIIPMERGQLVSMNPLV